MFIEKMHVESYMRKLLSYFKICEGDNPNGYRCACYGGRLHVQHQVNGKYKFESIFTDFEIISLYGYKPSEFDQIAFHNAMREIFKNDPDNYDSKLRSFNAKRSAEKRKQEEATKENKNISEENE